MGDSLYSNYDHKMSLEVEEMLRLNPLKLWAAHAGWDYFGRVWFDGQKWHSDVKVHGDVVAHIDGDSARQVIDATIASFGMN